MADNRISKVVKRRAEDFVYSTLRKFGGPLGYPSGGDAMKGGKEIHPPYEREVPPRFIYNLRRNQALINNAVEEKVNQTFRRGFTEFEKAYIAKCPVCNTEYESIEPFRNQLGEAGEDITEDDIDFSKPRPCPDDACRSDGPVDFQTPDETERDDAENFVARANHRGRVDEFLEGNQQNSVGQTYLEVCKEVAWDVESFDDGWMLFERDYFTQGDEIVGWKLNGVHRAPPELMRYDVGGEKMQDQKKVMNKKGHTHWACVKCRATTEGYRPQDHPGTCDECDAMKTYPVYAKMLDQPGGEAREWYIRGEFAHASLYEPSKFYGFSPIISLYEEARVLEYMDSYYREAYEERRAPRGAMVVRSSNAESVRSFNQQQMEMLRNDPHHIPTFMDDTEGRGNPLTWQPLLKEPAEMQHMQMREWFLQRISAKWGVTSVFQNATNENGQGQSMEIVVSNRAADRLRKVFNNVFLPALLSQLHIEGWTLEVAEVEEEDRMAEADLQGKFIRNAQIAQQVGAEVEWTEDDQLDIKPGMLEMPDEAMGGEGGGGPMGGMMGGMDGGPPDAGGPPDGPPGGPPGGDGGPATPFDDLMASQSASEGATSGDGGRPYEANHMGGEPRTRRKPSENRPITASDGAVTTGSSGFSNATYGGVSASTTNDSGIIDIMAHMEEMLDDHDDEKDREKARTQVKSVYDVAYGDLGLNAETIEKYAEADKGISELRNDNDGDWMQYPRVEHAATTLYTILNEHEH